MTTVLVADTDPHVVRALRTNLTARGYQVVVALSGAAALRAAAQARPDMVVLELDLPDNEGTDVIAALRGRTAVPIIVLSHRAEGADKVRALDTGADDYLTKPFEMPELLARLRAARRRAVAAAPGEQENRLVDTGSFTVDLAAKKVWREGMEVHLTPTEWGLLEILVRHQGRLVTQRQLLSEVWAPSISLTPHYLRVYLGQLRRKLEPQPARPRHLITEPGMGYRFLY